MRIFPEMLVCADMTVTTSCTKLRVKRGYSVVRGNSVVWQSAYKINEYRRIALFLLTLIPFLLLIARRPKFAQMNHLA